MALGKERERKREKIRLARLVFAHRTTLAEGTKSLYGKEMQGIDKSNKSVPERGVGCYKIILGGSLLRICT